MFTFIALGVVDETVFDKACGLTSWTVRRIPPVDLLFSGDEDTVPVRRSQAKDLETCCLTIFVKYVIIFTVDAAPLG